MKYIKVILLLAVLVWQNAFASYDFIVDGLAYSIHSDNTSVSVVNQDNPPNYYVYFTGDIVIPQNVTYEGKTYLVTAIGGHAFRGRMSSGTMYSITSISIPNSVTSIGHYAFENCVGLTSVTIPNSVTFLGESVFSGCTGLLSVYIGNSVNSIKSKAFCNCVSLTSVTIPNSVTSIENSAFENCANLSSVNIPDSVTFMGESVFSGCSGLLSVYIGNSVNSIKSKAFCNCVSLTSVTIPNSVTSIENSAFENCANLSSVNIPDSVTFMGESVFSGCSGLTSVTIGKSVTSIGSYAFKNCNSLTSIIVDGSNSKYDSRNNCNAIIETETNTLIVGCKGTTIPNSVSTIGQRAFYGSGLMSVTIPSSVTAIGNNAFSSCISLSSIVWNVKQYSYFSNNDNNPFYLSPDVKTLTIGSEVEYIPSYLCYCFGSSLTNIYSHIDNPDNVTLSSNVFCNVDKSRCLLTVPVASLELYRSASQWCDFLNIHPDVYVTNISLNKDQLVMIKGDTETLLSSVLPTNAYPVVNWTSSNTNIVTVDQNGNVTAKAAGTATITATTTDGSNLSASCTVQVFNRVSSVTLNYTSLVIEKGYSKQITATVSPSNAYNKKLLWSSSNPSVAEVDSTGLVTAINVGNTVISATTTDGSNITATCNVEVRAYANAVVLNKHETSLYAGGTEQLTAQVLPEDAYNKTVIWRTTNSTFASVNSSGLVMANKVGSALIIATCNGISDTCAVTVIGITSLTLDKHELTLDIESTETLNAIIEPQEAIIKNLTWRSLNTSVAIVSSSGVITPKGIGTTRIIVQTTDGSNLSDTCVVTVIPAYDLYPTTTELVHVRGQSDFSAVIPFWMSNKTAISGLQFDITLPTGVSFATVDDYPDVWLDANRKARNHTVDVNLISGSKYRVLVSSPTNNTFKGNEG